MHCFCPGCRTGYPSNTKLCKKEGKKMPSLFRAPKDPYLFEMWRKAIPRADRKLGSKDHVCALHFREEEIVKYFETKLTNRIIHRMSRDRVRLKSGAVPSIFPNVPGHSSFVENEMIKTKKKVTKAKISCVDKKTNRNDTTLQREKENILMEVIVVHPTSENSSTMQLSHLKERQNAKKTVNSFSDLQKHAILESETSASPCLLTDAMMEIPSMQNTCNKILTESPIPDTLMQKGIERNSSTTNITQSPMPDTRTENYSEQNSSQRTIIESSVSDSLTDNYSSSVTNITQTLAPDTLIESYFQQNSSEKTITESFVPVELCENSSKQNTSYNIATESSVLDAITEKYPNHSICDATMIEYPTSDTFLDNYSEQNNDMTLEEFSKDKPDSNANPNICDKIRTESDVSTTEPNIEEFVSFDFLKVNANIFETTDSWWRVNTFEDFIVFSRWTPDYSVERRIVITKDLDVKVFLLDKETTIGRDMKKFSVYDIAKLIYRVENLKFCSDIDKKGRNCAGFLQAVLMCRRYNLCLNCIKWRKEDKKKKIKQFKKSPNCIELLNFNLIT